MTDPAVFETLIAAGWFPFVEIITAEFRDLARQAEAGFGIAEIEPKIIAAFDASRLGHLFERWAAKSHFAARAALLKEAVEAFTAQKPASVIKIILTEIEGVLNDAHKAAHGGQGGRSGTCWPSPRPPPSDARAAPIRSSSPPRLGATSPPIRSRISTPWQGPARRDHVMPSATEQRRRTATR